VVDERLLEPATDHADRKLRLRASPAVISPCQAHGGERADDGLAGAEAGKLEEPREELVRLPLDRLSTDDDGVCVTEPRGDAQLGVSQLARSDVLEEQAGAREWLALGNGAAGSAQATIGHGWSRPRVARATSASST
jgi:hypothetical protein